MKGAFGSHLGRVEGSLSDFLADDLQFMRPRCRKVDPDTILPTYRGAPSIRTDAHEELLPVEEGKLALPLVR